MFKCFFYPFNNINKKHDLYTSKVSPIICNDVLEESIISNFRKYKIKQMFNTSYDIDVQEIMKSVNDSVYAFLCNKINNYIELTEYDIHSIILLDDYEKFNIIKLLTLSIKK